MRVHGANRLVVLSVDAAFVKRICALCQRDGYPDPSWLSEPFDLWTALAATKRITHGHQYDRTHNPRGLILDLGSPAPLDTGRVVTRPESEGEAKLVGYVALLLSLLSGTPRVPLAIASNSASLDTLAEVLAEHEGPFVELINRSADDFSLRLVLARLVAQPWPAAFAAERSVHSPPTSVKLHSDLWVDLDGCALQHADRVVPLTAREFRLLVVLTRSPGRFHGVHELQSVLSLGGRAQADKHCLQQTISGLRNKLGESGKRPRVLVNRRGLGYALFPQED